MTGSFAYTVAQWQEANAAWLAWLKGDAAAVKSEIEQTQSAPDCHELEADIEALRGSATRATRAELHFKIALHRDARYAMAGSQFCLRLAAQNRRRVHYECARTMTPLEQDNVA